MTVSNAGEIEAEGILALGIGALSLGGDAAVGVLGVVLGSVRVVMVLARGMTEYRPAPDEREPLAAGHMLVITACPPKLRTASKMR